MLSLHLDRFFQISERGSTIRTEINAGITTFLTMAYIIVVNPSILHDAGVPFSGAMFATCVSAAFGTLLMALLTNYPYALAPGMGINAYFAYTVVIGLKYDWRVALGAVFLSGIAFVVLTLIRVRALIVDAIPITLKTAIAAGIGLFIAFIGLRNAGVIVASPATLVTLGHVTSLPVALSLLGLVLTGALMAKGMRSGMIIGILVVTVVAIVFGISPRPTGIVQKPDWESTFLQLDIRGALKLGLLEVVFVFLFVDMFDTIGSLVGLGRQSGMLTPEGKLPRINRALFADAAATVAGAGLGTSTVTPYVESATGISQGGRTGLTGLVVAILFLLGSLFSPLASAVPAIATAPALVIVGVLMVHATQEINWLDLTEGIPAFITMLAMPLTYSIANGLALGFILYPFLKVITGRWREPSPLVYALAVLFILRFIYLGGG